MLTFFKLTELYKYNKRCLSNIDFLPIVDETLAWVMKAIGYPETIYALMNVGRTW